ncbi:MAG: cytochrome b/b6 domain-containing protein [Oceanococcus sp.]
MNATSTRYNRVAMSLHWLIALAIIGNLALGWWMHGAIEQVEQQALATLSFQWHKSIGLSILLLSILRLLWRLAHRPPALPSSLKVWERHTAHFTHFVLYLLMLGVPLSGWLYVSTQWRGEGALTVPTLWFGWIEVPHLLGLNHLADAQRQWWSEIGFTVHELLTQALAGLLLLHIAAALTHQFYSHDDILARMFPSSRRGWLFGCLSLLSVPFVIAVLANFGAGNSNDAATKIQSSESGWQADEENSEIGFSGVHADETFHGYFAEWWVDLQLNPAAPAQSTLRARIKTSSARDGDVLHEQTLPQSEWFDSNNHPEAEFTSSLIKPLNTGDWAVFGTLTIKGRQVQVGPLPLKILQNQATLSAQIKIDRADFNMGMQSDPNGKWVSRDIEIHITLMASARE